MAAVTEIRRGCRLPSGDGGMRYLDLVARWRMRQELPHTHAHTHLRVDHRPEIAAAMCSACARRWLRGKSLLCPTCGVKLRNAFDLYFERLHEQP